MNEIECEACIKRKTMYCPNSNECFETDDKPHWENRITLLEKYSKLQNNWNELDKWLIEKLKEYQKSKYPGEYGLVLGFIWEMQCKMEELEQGKDE